MSSLRTEKNGFVILLVLVAVAIMMLLYFVQIDAFFGPGLPSERAGIEEHPWALEELLAPDGEDIKLPRRPKLELEEAFSITAPVNRNDAERGEVIVKFNTDGRIVANWQCIYEQTEVNYRVDAQTSGNIHVKRTYQDETGKDKSRLFFIARGRYTKTPLGETAGTGGEKGTAWLTGWIGPDRTMQGHVTLTTNQQWAAVYAFESPE
jgi:hypothetical protein